MKFALLVAVTGLTIATACNPKPNQSPEPTSNRIPCDSMPRKFVFSETQLRGRLDSATACLMHRGYLQNPISTLQRTTGEKIRGWYMNQEDLNLIHTNASKGARIYLGFINNEYHLIMVPVNNDSANVLISPNEEATDRRTVVDDFKPCPDQCPADKGANLKAIWRYDLNFLRINGDGHHEFENFQGSSVIIKP